MTAIKGKKLLRSFYQNFVKIKRKH